MGADMCEWVEESGYEGDDPFGAWVADLTYRASGGFCLEEIWAHEARGLAWNQEKQRWLPAEQNTDRAEKVVEEEGESGLHQHRRHVLGVQAKEGKGGFQQTPVEHKGC